LAFLCGLSVSILIKIQNRYLRNCLITVIVLFFLCIPALPSIPGQGNGYPEEICISPQASGDLAGDPKTWDLIKSELQDNLNLFVHSKKHIRVEFKKFSSTSAQLSALQSNKTNFVSFLGSGTTVTAALDPKYHYLPYIVLCDTNQRPLQYTAVFVVKRENPLSESCTNWPALISVLKANPSLVVGLGDTTSTSNYRIPRLALLQAGIKPRTKLYESQGDLITAVALDNDIFAACVASDVLDRSDDKIALKPVPWGSGADPTWTNSFPSVSIGWRNDLAAPVQLCIASALTQHTWTPKDYRLRLAYTARSSKNEGPQTGGFRTIEDFSVMWTNAIKVKEAFDAVNWNQ